MSDQPFDQPNSRHETDLDAPRVRVDRSFARCTFREMIKLQIDDKPLRWSQRRELVRFARRLGIDAFEAKLLIRAVEYELGLVRPASMDARGTDAETAFVASDEESLGGGALSLFGPIAVMAALLLTWLFTAVK